MFVQNNLVYQTLSPRTISLSLWGVSSLQAWLELEGMVLMASREVAMWSELVEWGGSYVVRACSYVVEWGSSYVVRTC